MVSAAGAALWVFALGLLTLVLRRYGRGLSAKGVILLLALLFSASFFFFRPQENIFGGEDPGSYLNSSLSYLRHERLFIPDPLMDGFDARQKHAFLFGHHGYGPTQDAVLWLKRHAEDDNGRVVAGPWFQPAYPVMMAFAARLFPDRAVLYVVPLFAVLCGITVGCLARRITGSGLAALLAMALYYFNPVLAWHGRCPRPEIPASFFLLSGLLLAMGRDDDEEPEPAIAFVAGFSMVIAGLFHITALLAAIPAGAVFAASAWCRRRSSAFLVCSGLAAGMAILLLQAIFITDPYHLLKKLPAIPPMVYPVMALVVSAGFAGAGRWSRVRPRPLHPGFTDLPKLVNVFATSCVVLLAGAAALGLSTRTLEQLPAWTAAYLGVFPTMNIVRTLSPALLVAGLSGWLLVSRSTPGRRGGAVVLLAVLILPVLFPGWVKVMMFESRRFAAFVVPFFVLGAAVSMAFVLRGALAGRSRVWLAPLVLVTAIIGGDIARHPQLFRHHDLAGTWDGYEQLAEHLDPARDIVIGEFSGLSAPLEHLFGIPVLTVMPGARSPREYEHAVAAWKKMADRHPDRRLFFLTPFEDPVVEGFRFVPVAEAAFSPLKLERAMNRVPDRLKPREIRLKLFSVEIGAASPRSGVLVRGAEHGYFSMENMSAVRPVRDGISGTAWPAGTQTEITLPAGSSEAVVFFACSDVATAPVEFDDGPVNWLPLDGQFIAARISGSGSRKVSVLCETVVTDLWIKDASGRWARAEPPSGPRSKVELSADRAIWTRSKSSIFMPVEDPGLVLILANPRRAPELRDREVSVSSGGTQHAMAHAWAWYVFPAVPGSDRVEFVTEPVWNPGIKGLHKDLGFQFVRVAVVAD